MSDQMKIHSFLFFCFAILMMLPSQVSAQRWGIGAVLVYDQPEGRGNESGFNVGEFRSTRGEFGTLRNKSAFSVSVPPGFRVKFCENEGRKGEGGGRCEEFAEGNHDLRYGGTASYIHVFGPRSGGDWNNGWRGDGEAGVTVYENRNFLGNSQSFAVGRYLNIGGGLGSLGNDKASSVVVSPGFRVRLCENEGTSGAGEGRCEDFSEGRFNLKYDNTASYVEVRRMYGGWHGGWSGGGAGNGGNTGSGPVIVYSEKDQKGNQQAFGVGTFLNIGHQLGAIGNDNASSVFVERGYRVRFCEDEGKGNGAGRCEDFGPGSYNLKYYDKASFIRVWRNKQ